jgi:AcrR family transcriptional regulator
MGRQRIVDVALEIARERGVKAVTMTSVAERLGVAMPALYYHVSSRDELLGLIGNSLLDTETPEQGAATDWKSWMREFAHSLREHAKREPTLGVVPSISAYGLLSVPVIEQGLEVLTRAGFGPTDAMRYFGQLTNTVLSTVYRDYCLDLERAQGRTQLSMLRAMMHNYSRDEAPVLTKLLEDCAHLPDDTDTDQLQRFERKINTMLDGIEVALSRTSVGHPR